MRSEDSETAPLLGSGPVLRHNNACVRDVLTAPSNLSLIHISEPTRPEPISYAVFCLKKNILKIFMRSYSYAKFPSQYRVGSLSTIYKQTKNRHETGSSLSLGTRLTVLSKRLGCKRCCDATPDRCLGGVPSHYSIFA